MAKVLKLSDFQKQADIISNVIGHDLPIITGRPGRHNTASMTTDEKKAFTDLSGKILKLFGVECEPIEPEEKKPYVGPLQRAANIKAGKDAAPAGKTAKK